MISYIVNDKERVSEFVWRSISCRESPYEKYQAIGMEKDGELVAGAVFDNFTTGVRCSIHCAGLGKYWLTRTFLHMCFDYIFNIAKCKVVVNSVAENNSDSVRFTSHIGFKECGRVKNGGGENNDLIIFAMQKDECRWI